MEAPDYSQPDNRSTPTKPYFIYGIVFLAALGIVAELVALIFGGTEAQQKAQMIITFLTPIIFALIALQQQQTHKLVNSQSIQVQELIGQRSFAAGVKAGENTTDDSNISPTETRQT